MLVNDSVYFQKIKFTHYALRLMKKERYFPGGAYEAWDSESLSPPLWLVRCCHYDITWIGMPSKLSLPKDSRSAWGMELWEFITTALIGWLLSLWRHLDMDVIKAQFDKSSCFVFFAFLFQQKLRLYKYYWHVNNPWSQIFRSTVSLVSRCNCFFL